MNFSSALVLILSLLVCTTCAAKRKQSLTKQGSFKVKCDNTNQKKADVCADKLWFVGKNSRKYPENIEQFKKHCKQTLGLIKCAKDYTDTCAKGVQKQLANVMLYTAKMNQKSYCSKATKSDEVISFAACGNAIWAESSACMDNFLSNLGKANAGESKFKVGYACCAFHQLKTCILNAGKLKSDPMCPEKKLDSFERYINAMAGNTLNLMCTDYEEDSDKCSKLPPIPKGAKYNKTPTIMTGFGELLVNL